MCENLRVIILWQNFTEALGLNPGERREIFMHCVGRGQWTTSERAFTVLYKSQ